jgi:hypothetical protein
MAMNNNKRTVFVMIKQHILILGLNDKDTKKQEISTIDAYKIATNILTKYFDGATITEAQGFYKHEDGTLTFETSLKIELLFADDEQVLKVIEQLKTAFNQESIALITNDINSKLI